jgi:hypothetical protein
MKRTSGRGGTQRRAAFLAAVALALALAPGAQAHVLSKSRAVSAARSAATGLARKRVGDVTQPTFSRPSCTRRSPHRFVCTTTVSGTAACDHAEASCETVRWELSYVITVKLRSARSGALSVATSEA